MKKEIHILCLEDSAADVAMLSHVLRRGGLKFRCKRVETKQTFLQELEHHPPDLILSDRGLPSFDGFTALALARDKCPEVPFIFVTGSPGEKAALETLKSGATDYVLKSDLVRLAPAVERALREARERRVLRHRERQLRESEERFRLLVEGVKDYAIYMLDEAGCVATWNSGAEAIEGYTAEEILGQPLATFFTPEDVRSGAPTRLLRTAAAEGRTVNEGWRVRKDGSRFWTEGMITALRDPRGKLLGFSKIAHDITKQKQAEERIRQLNEQLEERVRERTAQLEAANQELEAFSYSVSHDLRAPLRHIAGYVEVLQSEAAPRLDEASRQLLQTIAQSAKTLGDLIDALLAFSRMGRAELTRQPVDLAALVEEARHEMAREIQGRAIDWQIGPLPQVQGDPFMLRQVLINLVSNAVKYTRQRERATIEIGAIESDRDVTFHIRDNGVGFDPHYADKLFGVFQRLHPASEFEGIGIGLANVARIIRRHGGCVWAEGAVNRGATFHFSIPKPLKEEV